jgi:hypothetical protein
MDAFATAQSHSHSKPSFQEFEEQVAGVVPASFTAQLVCGIDTSLRLKPQAMELGHL